MLGLLVAFRAGRLNLNNQQPATKPIETKYSAGMKAMRSVKLEKGHHCTSLCWGD